jgi:hypothetical protein
MKCPREIKNTPASATKQCIEFGKFPALAFVAHQTPSASFQRRADETGKNIGPAIDICGSNVDASRIC